MVLPWIIALISTDYDLQDERAAIRAFLKSHGIDVSAFEEPDFPVMQNAHSHDNCLQALKRADIAIVLINRRYGGKYYLNEEISITEKEYEELRIPKVVLVNSKVWDERAVYRKQQQMSGLSEDAYASSGRYVPVNVETVQVFRFIDRIQNSYSLSGRSNWINFWSDLEDLKQKVPLVLQSLSITMIHQILEKQKQEVARRKTSTGLSLSLGDVIERKLYIETGYEEESGELKEGETLSEKINNKLAGDESCRILGEAGAGKTTLMAKCFLEKANSAKDSPFDIPVYVWLKEKGKDYPFSIQSYLSIGCEKYLNKNTYPFFSTDGIRFTFFLDGFDELAEKLTQDDLNRLIASDMFQWPVILTSRTQYAERYLTSNDFSSKFSACIRLTDWSEETAREYIDRFCNIQEKGEEFKKRINGLLTDNPDLRDVLKSPLLITVLLYVIEKSRMQIPETVTSRVSLFEKCFDILAKREIETKIGRDASGPGEEELVLYWSYFAWCIYKARLEGQYFIPINEAIETISGIFKAQEQRRWPSTVYDAVFDTSDDRAFGAFHEQFLEYLVASALAYACRNKIEPYPEFLKYVMRPEINRYFKAIVEQRPSDEKNQIINRIVEQYMDCAGSASKEDIAKRVHAVYHLSRLDFSGRSERIDKIFHMETEKAVLQSLYFGAIKNGDMEREREFYNLLIADDEYSNANRGYHLAYYDTIGGQRELPYSDDASINWSGTLNAFLRHFESRNREHYRLRRIDLVTMRQLMKFRSSPGPLTDDVLAKFEDCVFHPKLEIEPDFQAAIEREFENVKTLYHSLTEGMRS